jgi:hypothetical protein
VFRQQTMNYRGWMAVTLTSGTENPVLCLQKGLKRKPKGYLSLLLFFVFTFPNLSALLLLLTIINGNVITTTVRGPRRGKIHIRHAALSDK